MKINLSVRPSNISGYTNICASSGGNISCLDDKVCDAEAEEILATDVINFIPVEEVERIIDAWLIKLRHGGKIVIGGIDAYEVCRSVAQASSSIADFNNIVHSGRVSQISISHLIDILSKRGLRILKKRISGFNMVVEAQRP